MIFLVARTLLVGLTAATTLLASTPHVRCRCSDGSVKPVCFSHLTSTSPDCCSQKDEGSEEELPSCCRERGDSKKSPSNQDDSDAGETLSELRCQKSLVQAEPATAVAQHKATEQATGDSFVLVATVTDCQAPSICLVASIGGDWLPERDLITFLRHFVI